MIENDHLGFGKLLGELIGKLHAADIIHGDLTTSNVISIDRSLHLIDFGLSQFSLKIEDKSVELNLLLRALESKHPQVASEIFEQVIMAYLTTYSEGNVVVDRFENKVLKRGRNKGKN